MACGSLGLIFRFPKITALMDICLSTHSFYGTFIMNSANKKMHSRGNAFLCRSAGDRTLDPMIKSHVLYQLSYGPERVQR